MDAQPLTERQRSIVQAVKTLTEEKGYAPSVRDVMTAVGLKSSSSAGHHIKSLCALGYLVHDPRTPRSLRVVHLEAVDE